MWPKKRLLLGILVFLLSGCNSNVSTNKRDIHVQPILIDPTNVKPNLDLSSITEDSVDIIPLQITEECLISEIQRLEFTRDNIFVSDRISQRIYLFNSSGKYIKTVGRKGNGPGEYARLGDFSIFGDSILIQDSSGHKYIIYNWKKNNYTEIPYEADHFEMLCFGNTVYQISSYLETKKGNYNLFKYDLTSRKIKGKYIPFNTKNNRCDWLMSRSASKYGDKALLTFSLNDTIYEIDKSGYFPLYTVRFTERNIPQEMIQDSKGSLSDIARKQGYLIGLRNIQNSSRYWFGEFGDGGKLRYVIFNKDTLKNEVGGQYIVGKNTGELPFYFFYTMPDNELVLMQPASMLLTNWKYYGTKVEDNLVKRKLDQIVGTLNEDDNPILFKYKFK